MPTDYERGHFGQYFHADGLRIGALAAETLGVEDGQICGPKMAISSHFKAFTHSFVTVSVWFIYLFIYLCVYLFIPSSIHSSISLLGWLSSYLFYTHLEIRQPEVTTAAMNALRKFRVTVVWIPWPRCSLRRCAPFPMIYVVIS